jgi:hypothetical protein
VSLLLSYREPSLTASAGSNRLTEIPPLIGDLKSLRDLNVANNLLRYLPSEITNLALTSLSVHPNPFHLSPPGIAVNDKEFGETILLRDSVPTLTEYSMRRLIRPLYPGGHQSALEEIYTLPLPTSASGLTEDLLHPLIPAPKGSRNPNQLVCPSPYHAEQSSALFVEPTLERFQWIDHIGALRISHPRVPIKWKGCSASCLNFLKDDAVTSFESGLGPNDESFTLSSDEESDED